jgi:Protein of unknown function (DUF3999)
MKRVACWTIGVAAICTAACGAEPDFRYKKSLQLPALGQDELVAASFDSDVYAATRDGFPDVRIRADQGDVSYLLRKATATTSDTIREYFAANSPEVHPREDGSLEIIVHLGDKDPQPQGLRLATPLHNFEQRVRVFTSVDGKDWKPLGDEAVVFDYSQYIDARSDTLDFPATTDRYFKIVIDHVTQELQSQLKELTRRLRGDTESHRDETILIERRPFRIDRLEFWHETAREHVAGDRKISYPVASFRVETDPESEQTIVSVDSRREPLTSLTLATSSRNFSRRVEVQTEQTDGVQHSWQTIGTANLSRLDFRNLKRENLTVAIVETRTNAYRIVIDNRGSPPLAITGVEAKGNQYETVFMAAADQPPLEMLYCSETAQAPDYDTAAITASLAANYQPLSATLGPQIVVSGRRQPESFSWSRLVNDPYVLGGVAVLLVAALAWGLFHAGRRLERLSDGDG